MTEITKSRKVRLTEEVLLKALTAGGDKKVDIFSKRDQQMFVIWVKIEGREAFETRRMFHYAFKDMIHVIRKRAGLPRGEIGERQRGEMDVDNCEHRFKLRVQLTTHENNLVRLDIRKVSRESIEQVEQSLEA